MTSSTTMRSFENFSDPLTYTYSAVYYVAFHYHSRDQVFICEPFPGEKSSCATRTVVHAKIISSGESRAKLINVEILKEEGIYTLRDFDRKWNMSKETIGNATRCPFTLNLALDANKAIYVEWDSETIGQENVLFFRTVQELQNGYRFTPQLVRNQPIYCSYVHLMIY